MPTYNVDNDETDIALMLRAVRADDIGGVLIGSPLSIVTDIEQVPHEDPDASIRTWKVGLGGYVLWPLGAARADPGRQQLPAEYTLLAGGVPVPPLEHPNQTATVIILTRPESGGPWAHPPIFINII
jgi:hypothetical protein